MKVMLKNPRERAWDDGRYSECYTSERDDFPSGFLSVILDASVIGLSSFLFSMILCIFLLLFLLHTSVNNLTVTQPQGKCGCR